MRLSDEKVFPSELSKLEETICSKQQHTFLSNKPFLTCWWWSFSARQGSETVKTFL
jgi:hypothetical protein